MSSRRGDVLELIDQFHEMLCRAASNRQLANAIRHYAFAPEPIRAPAFASREIREIASAERFEMSEALAAGGADGFYPTIVLNIAQRWRGVFN